MTKPIIAVDIDNVLAVHADALMGFYNEAYGTSFATSEYNEDWSWMEDDARMEDFRLKFLKSGLHGKMSVVEGAQVATKKLTEKFELIIITARWLKVSELTHGWIEEHFPNTFKDVHFAQTRMWQSGSNKASKADICRQIGAEYLIDDNISHCKLAGEAGISCVLFGNYTWNRSDETFLNVVRCKDWPAVLEYFDGLG